LREGLFKSTPRRRGNRWIREGLRKTTPRVRRVALGLRVRLG
jgi:hypothetical protein